jgi:hypothetical protein
VLNADARKDARMLETPLTRLMITAINRLDGVRVWKMSNGVDVIPAEKGGKRRFNRYGMAGQADIAGLIIGGRRLEIEVKTVSAFKKKNHNMRDSQIAYEIMILGLGGIYFVECDVDRTVEKVRKLIANERAKLKVYSLYKKRMEITR